MATSKPKNINIPSDAIFSKETIEARTLLICSRLIQIRKKFELSQTDLSEIIGTTQSVISHYEKEHKVNGTVTKVLMYFFLQYNLNPLWLFADDNKNYPMTLGSESSVSKFDYRDNVIRDSNARLDSLKSQIEALQTLLSS